MRQIFDVQYQVIAYIERARAAKASWTKTVTSYHTEVAFRELAQKWSKEAFKSISDQEREGENWTEWVDDFCNKKVSKMFEKYANTAFVIVSRGVTRALIVPVGREVDNYTVIDHDTTYSHEFEALLEAKTHKHALS